VTTMRATARFEKDVMSMRTVVIGVALASILAGVAAFVIGLRQPIDTHLGMANTVEIDRR
jgi:ABC-type nitrate/sulfonate/bicarbonate transport system permease component